MMPVAPRHKRPMPTLWVMFIILAAAAVDLASPPLQLKLFTEHSLTLEPALLMVCALIGGRWLSIALVILMICDVLLGGEPKYLPVYLLAALTCAELLRRGIAPLLATALLLVTTVIPLITIADGGMVLPDAITVAVLATEASATGARAGVVLRRISRRPMHYINRCRLRCEHVAFVLVVGTASFTTLGTLFSLQAANTTPQSPAILYGLLGLAHLASFVGARRFAKTMERLTMGRLMPSSSAAGASGRSARELPLEMKRPLLQLHRQAIQQRTEARQSTGKLRAAQHALAQLRNRLLVSERSLIERSSVLKRITHAHELTVARWRALIDPSSDVVIFADDDGKIEYVNRSVLGMLGFQPPELIGKKVSILLPDFAMDGHPLELATGKEESSRSLAPRIAEAAVRKADGKQRELAIRVQEFSLAGNRKFAIQLRDSSGMKRALSIMESAKATAQAAHRSQETFIAATSHELRTPLHGLIATLDMLRDERLSPEGERRLGIAKASSRSLLNIANDILDLTRIGSDAFSLERSHFSLKAIIQEVVAEATDQARTRKLRLSGKISSRFPPSFIGDPQRMKQIIGNLVSNALKFTSHGSISVNAHFDGQLCTIDVADTGEGIPHDKQAAIFEPFVQVESTSRADGAGLGLSISKRLSEAMGGRLVLRSSGPAGSIFRLVLPLQPSNEPVSEDQSQRVFNNPRGRILVVEDHPANQYVVQGMLNALECPSQLAQSGSEALSLLENQEFDLILMDCRMPGMDGYETTRRAKSLLKKHIPIIAMTANATLEDKKRCLEAGMDDFLTKPFGRRTLNDILCKWLMPQPEGNSADGVDRYKKTPVLDQSVFDELWENLRWQLPPMRRIGETFMSTAQKTLESLGTRNQETERHLHTLLGTAGMIGARQVEYLAARLQGAVKAQRATEVDSMHGQLSEAIQAFEHEFTVKLGAAHGRFS